MHIHEYQAKGLFRQLNIRTPKATLISAVEQVNKACTELGGKIWVVKAQVHAGGRGKGGGVILCRSIKDAEDACEKLSKNMMFSTREIIKKLNWINVSDATNRCQRFAS